MRSLVTGGAGFIGSTLADALVAAGDEVTIVDDLSRGRREQVTAAAAFEEVDILDAPALAAAFAAAAPQRVFHLAAQVSVRHSTADPLRDAAVNVRGTINALEAARSCGARRFVNASTGGAIYGEDAPRPTPESHQPAPKSPYGQSKLSAEGYCELFRRLHGLDTVTLRYGNVYGPRQDPHGEAGVVAIFAGKRLAGEAPRVFGDGEQTRDYVYVDDVVAANLAVAESNAGGVFNVGTGTGTSVLDLVRVFAALGEGEFAPVHAEARAGDVRHTALDAGRACSELGWEPGVLVDEGIARTFASLTPPG